jgi:hypothetical protein
MPSDTAAAVSAWEYVTYAPSGNHCSACMAPIEKMEPVLRGSMERSSGPPVVIYRHTGKCPQQ